MQYQIDIDFIPTAMLASCTGNPSHRRNGFALCAAIVYDIENLVGYSRKGKNMTENAPQPQDKSGCPVKACLGKFDYCFWAKLMIAIPLLPFIALLAAMQFTDPKAQAIAGVAA